MIALGDAYLGTSSYTGKSESVRKPLDAMRQAQVIRRHRSIEARYDAAQDSDSMKNYWASADHFDADSANSPHVRAKLRSRSRYEVANNGYADGIAQTYATAVVGIGPKLRMETLSTGFNQMVEREWLAWCKSVQLRRKLWTMAHAKHTDGEGIGTVRTNMNVRHAVKLDVKLHEAEELSTPYAQFMDPTSTDGIRFDEFGNPYEYDFLRYHPGAANHASRFTVEPETIQARYVLHWLLMRRPGQHRGVPECASTLNDGASFRRWREAVLAAAEAAADMAVILSTDMPPGTADAAAPFSTVEFAKGMVTASPMGWDPHQMKSEHPNATYAEFHRSLVSGQARPKSMPYNVAACDSSSYNYASGRLDYQIWHGSLDVDREDCNDLVLDPLFDLWFDEAVMVFGWLGGNPRSVTYGARAHSWDWPPHGVADLEAEANSNQTRLRSGQTTMSAIYAAQGEDFTDQVERMAADYGVDAAKMREVLLHATFNAQNQLGGVMSAEAQQTQAEAVASKPQAQGANANG